MKILKYEIRPRPYCENCGDLWPYTLTFCGGVTSWCENCISCMTPEDVGVDDFPTKEEMKEYKKEARQAQIDYHKRQIERLENGE